MITQEQHIEAGGSVVFSGGCQFHLLECEYPVDILFMGSDRKPLERGTGISAHFKNTIDFQNVKVTSPIHPQTVKIGITNGDADVSRIYGHIEATLVEAPCLAVSYHEKSYKATFDCSEMGNYDSGITNWSPTGPNGRSLVHTKGRVVLTDANAHIYLGTLNDISTYHHRGLWLGHKDTFDLHHQGSLYVGGESAVRGEIYYFQQWEENA